ncbi:MAG TPA: BtrH N-terminal domain-containing protein [Candidatus Kapabacteria bacterium]|nr:BtrH N-terminal domain-containing protein [Candidatus Kapabacteria bacterium]
MTSDKGFKRLVRERAAKTGESYTTARMHLAKKEEHVPSHRGGTNAEANGIRNVLDHLGLPMSEAMVLGLGGGIGAGYIAITHGMTGFMIGSRSNWWDATAFVQRACDRIGAGVAFRETSSATTATKHLREALGSGVPPIAWLDLSCLHYSTLPPFFRKGGYHSLVVYDLDEENGRAVVGDLADLPLTVTPAELMEARKSITSFKNRLAVISAPTDPVDIAKAVLESARECAAALLKGRAKTFVLDGFRAWGTAVGAQSGKEAWSTLFRANRDIMRALTSVYRFVEQWGGRALLRPLYADFLTEAAALTGRGSLRDAAELYRECGARWHDVALAALPDGVPALRERRELMERSRRVLDERGDAGVDDVNAMKAKMVELAQRSAEEEFPLSAPELRELFDELGRLILHAHAAEIEAQAALAAAAA